jgi:pyruvate kinase
VTPLLLEEKQNADELFEHALERARAAGLAQEGDTVVLIAGVPVGIAGTTNLIKAHIV